MVIYERLTRCLHENMTGHVLEWGGIGMLLGCIWLMERIRLGMVILMARPGWSEISAARSYARAADGRQ